MIIVKQPSQLADFIRIQKANAQNIGFVPTMGALHEGHIQLVETASLHSDITVSSLFVNPTQFNNQNDFKKYPDKLENDLYLLQKSSADLVFVPPLNAIYPSGTVNLEHYELGYLETILEGRFRPGHFQGVCQVMSRLLMMVQPHLLFMGQKDYQQCMVIRKLIILLNLDIELIACPTIREADGLAMSSRNLRLNPEERKNAGNIYKTLSYVRDNIQAGNLGQLKREATRQLENSRFKVDYVEIADAETLQLTDYWNGAQPIVILIAAYLNEVRLIDNLVIDN